LRILDLFCGGGGAAMGLHQALEKVNIKPTIVGIDIRDMPEYPFEFVKADIFKMGYINYNYFDFIWASPPCQAWCDATQNKKNHPKLVKPIRNLLLKTNKPFVIENVQLAPIRHDLMLCGTMFNLKIFRHRYFEIHGFKAYQPKHFKHKTIIGKGFYTIVSGGFHRKPQKQKRKEKYNLDYGDYESWSNAMGIDWIKLDYTDQKSRKSYDGESGPTLCSNHPLAEAIPPAYSRYIMKEFLRDHPTLLDFIKEEKSVKC